jgi:uncharacterized membrane protein AbrB (regulator of aidB expression)
VVGWWHGLVPPRPAIDPEQARNAAAAIRAMSKGLLPEILLVSVGVPFLFGGPALLIVVCTLLDLEVQVRETARRAGPL